MKDERSKRRGDSRVEDLHLSRLLASVEDLSTNELGQRRLTRRAPGKDRAYSLPESPSTRLEGLGDSKLDEIGNEDGLMKESNSRVSFERDRSTRKIEATDPDVGELSSLADDVSSVLVVGELEKVLPARTRGGRRLSARAEDELTCDDATKISATNLRPS